MSEAERRGPRELRELLIRAAMQILEEPDMPLDLRKVAEVAGKSRTAPYLVFGKESEGGGLVALRIAVAAEGARRLADRMEGAAAGSSDPLFSFKAVALAFLSFVMEHPRLFRLMFGPETGVTERGSPRRMKDHPEFRRLLEHRLRSEEALRRAIEACQKRRLMPEGDTLRYTMIAWASMLGVAFLLLDGVLEAAGVRTELEDAASLITESVLGLDPEPLRDAAWTFLQAQAKSSPELLSDAPLVPDSMHALREGSPLGAYDSPAAAADRSSVDEWDLTDTISSFPGLRRAAQSREALHGAKLLWIDDQPASVRLEAETLERLRVHVAMARDTAEAVAALQQQSFDLIVSDITRGGDASAGVSALPDLRRWAPDTPVIFYILDLDPRRGIPQGAFGITDNVDELFHLIVDALERRRG